MGSSPERSIGRPRAWRSAIGLGVGLVVVALLCAGCVSGSAGTPLPTVPGSAGHYDDGQESFDYPNGWPRIGGQFSSGGVMYVLAVLGRGTWREGCVYRSDGFDCGRDTFEVASGGILVKVYRWWGGPAVPCRGDVQANATLGPNAVRKTVDGDVTSWEIRLPGNEFGQPNNIYVEAHTSTPSRLAEAEELVSSFRWEGSSNQGGLCTPTP